MRSLFIVLWALACTAVQPVRAAESADWLETIRSLRAQSRLAWEGGDREAAWRFNAAARALQPGHIGLIKQAIRMADDTQDSARLLLALRALADAGAALDVEPLKGVTHLPAAQLAQIRKVFAANREPVGAAKTAAEVGLPDALIESVAVDPERGHLYLGSVMDRTIYRVDPANPSAVEVFADKADGLYSVFGMTVEPQTRTLYVATGTVPQTPLKENEAKGTALMAFDLDTGTLRGRYEIDGARQMADLTVIDGQVYVSDSQAPHIYRLDGATRELSLFSSDPRFVSLQGLALLGDDLIVADYALGLWRVDRGTGKAVLVGAPMGSQSLLGIDGLMAVGGGTLLAVRNGEPPHAVMRLAFSPGGRLMQVRPELRGHPLFDEPTLMAISGKNIYLVARSQWPLFPADGSAPPRPRANPVILTWSLSTTRDRQAGRR